MRDESPVKDVESWKLNFVLIGASNIINWWKSEGRGVVKSCRLRIRKHHGTVKRKVTSAA